MKRLNYDSRRLYEYAASRVYYDPETGIMKWLPKPADNDKNRRWNGKHAWQQIGTVSAKGYLNFGLDYSDETFAKMTVARVAWFIVHNEIPDQVDHINGDRVDNRISNLRNVTNSENCRNKVVNTRNLSGVCGVTWHKGTGKWRSAVTVNGKSHSLGLHFSVEDAAKVVREFRSKHGFTDRHGLRDDT